MNFKLTAFLLTCVSITSFGQVIEKLKLTDTEIPAGYTSTDEVLSKSIQAGTFYEQTDLYAGLIGKIKNKTYQSFESKDDSGTIYIL